MFPILLSLSLFSFSVLFFFPLEDQLTSNPTRESNPFFPLLTLSTFSVTKEIISYIFSIFCDKTTFSNCKTISISIIFIENESLF